MSKALIVSGGGSKGAFAVGVIKDLYDNYFLNFDVLIGTSTGALIAPLAAMKEMATLERLYTTLKTEDLLEKGNLGERIGLLQPGHTSIFSANGLGNKIVEIYTDAFYNKLIQAGKKIYLATTCLQTEEPVVFTTDPNPPTGTYYTICKIQNAEHFRRAVMASASQPVFMPPVHVNKGLAQLPNYQYVDGGVREIAGVGIALDCGMTELFTILLSSKQAMPNNTGFTKLFPILEQTISTFITDVSENDLFAPKQMIDAINYMNAIKENMKSHGVPDSTINNYFNIPGINYTRFQNKPRVKWHIIQPEKALGGGPGGLDFDPVAMTAMVGLGKIALENYVANLKPGDTDWAGV